MNFVFTLHDPKITPQELLSRSEVCKDLNFIIFQGEITPTKGGKSTSHFQGYLEFKVMKSIKFIKRELFGNEKSPVHLEGRRGTQKEAIDYCSDKKKELFLEGTFQGGQPKVDYSTWNRSNKDIPLTQEEQGIHIDKEIIAGRYLSLKDIRRDYPYLVIHHRAKLQSLINEHNPIAFSELVPAKVIGLYGRSGAGKSCLNSRILKERGYQDQDISYLKSDLETVCWFDYSDENKRALVCEEVRSEGPKYNSLINWIDKKSFLPVKGSLIRNNFELIIINSLDKPEEVYADVPLKRRIEPLRRIYSGAVYHVERDNDSIQKTKEKLARNELAAKEFPYYYNPNVTNVTNQIPALIAGLFS